MTQTRLYFEAGEDQAKSINTKLELAFEDDGFPVAVFETDEKKALWTISVYAPRILEQDTEKRMRAVLDSMALRADILKEELEDEGWIEKTLSGLAPVRAGRYLVHGSHDKHFVKPNDTGILIDAGLAFGTGHHGTTAGCLEMIARELKHTRPRNALDLGAGTGVLAIAIAKSAPIPVLASDIDRTAQKVAQQNATINGVCGRVHSISATGFNHQEISHRKPFDLIVANILAGPLQKLARDVAANIAPGGTLILSGLLPHQKSRIVASYRTMGFRLVRAHVRDNWLTLVMRDMRTRKV